MKRGLATNQGGRILAAFVITSLLAIGARADVVTIGAAKDTTIFGGFVSNSLGGGPGLFAGDDNAGNTSRGLMQFNVAANVPAGSTITNVQLTLTLGLVAGSGMSPDTTPRTISLFRLGNSWGEGTNGSSFTGMGGTGNGFAAQAGDATWNARFYDATTPTLWTAAGGDASAGASGSTTVGQTLGAYTWTSTAAMVSDVQGWLDTPASNLGWLIRNGTESGPKTFRAFWTREASDTSVRPQLQITFVPEAGSASVGIILGWFGLSRRNRRQRLIEPFSS